MKKYLKHAILLMALVFICAMPVSAAANKGVRIMVKPFGWEADIESQVPSYVMNALWERNYYLFMTGLKTKTKLLKTNTLSGRFYVSKDILSFDNCSIDINAGLSFSKNGSKWLGITQGQGFYRIAKEDGKFRMYHVVGDEDRDASSLISVKASGDYYVVTFKDLKTLPTYYNYEKDLDNQPVITNTAYYLEYDLGVFIRVPKTVKGYFYLDQVSAKAAKNQTATFNKKDYKYADVSLDEHNLNAPIVKIGS